jgi:ribosome-binding factor A
MSSFRRADRVAGEVLRGLSEILLDGVKDPRVSSISLTSVSLSDDLRTAHVRFVPLGGDGDPDRILEGLEAARGFLRRELGRKLRLKVLPQLHFHIDRGLDEAFRVNQLIESLHTEGDE